MKTVAESSYEAVGDVLHYTYVTTNTGNVTLGGPFSIFDNRSTDAACPPAPASLAPGEAITCSGTYAVIQADLDAGLVTNTATGRADFHGSAVDSNARLRLP